MPAIMIGDEQMSLPITYNHYVRQAGGDGHLAIVLAVLARIPTPAERVHWLLARLPDSAAYFGVDQELIGRHIAV